MTSCMNSCNEFSCLYFSEIKFGEKMCLDTLEHKSGNVGLWECHGEGRNQVFYYKEHISTICYKHVTLYSVQFIHRVGRYLFTTYILS